MTIKLTEHIDLEELVPPDVPTNGIPVAVHATLQRLAEEILERVRRAMDAALVVHDAYRPPARNAAVGGVATSDHQTGAAADFHIASSDAEAWEDMTRRAFDWIRENLDGQFGQLIWEDQRAHFGVPGKLWVHVSLPTAKHPGTADDPNRLLVCSAPGSYAPWRGWA